VDFPPEQEISLFCIAYLQSSQLANGSVPPGSLTAAVKRPEREADHSPAPNAKVTNEWSCTSTPDVPLTGTVPLLFFAVR
jgi:hypothetical protein